MQMRMALTVTAVVILALAWTPAPAQPRRTGASPCRADVEKFCKDVETGAGRIHRCLEQHEAELSDACRQHVQQMRERASTIEAACKDEVAKFCKSASRGGGRVRNCLRRHEPELSPSCKTALEGTKQP